MLCVDIAGFLHNRDSGVHDLAASYLNYGRIWPVIAEAALELLP